MKNWIDWDDVPEILNKEQLCRLCHISKATAAELLETEKIPCRSTGKKTRCYSIQKSDVLEFLHSRGVYPENFNRDADWYNPKRPNSVGLPRELPAEVLKKLHSYYSALLIKSPDVLTTQDVINLTGYSKTAVNHWCYTGLLPHLHRGRSNFIPKTFLVDFFCSDYFRNIGRKTKWHIYTLRDFYVRLQDEKRRMKGIVKYKYF